MEEFLFDSCIYAWYKLRDYTRTLNCRRESERINVFNPYVAAVLQNINKQQKDYEKGKWD